MASCGTPNSHTPGVAYTPSPMPQVSHNHSYLCVGYRGQLVANVLYWMAWSVIRKRFSILAKGKILPVLGGAFVSMLFQKHFLTYSKPICAISLFAMRNGMPSLYKCLINAQCSFCGSHGSKLLNCFLLVSIDLLQYLEDKSLHKWHI